jgi:hypothetical protein
VILTENERGKQTGQRCDFETRDDRCRLRPGGELTTGVEASASVFTVPQPSFDRSPIGKGAVRFSAGWDIQWLEVWTACLRTASKLHP